MPYNEFFLSVGDKEQHMYEYVKASELKQGRPAKRAKAIAAATVTKHHNAGGHTRGKWLRQPQRHRLTHPIA